MWLSATLIGLYTHGERAFDAFLPLHVPLWLQPLLVVLELLGSLARSLALGVRLSANMLAGHSLLKLTCGLVFYLASHGGLNLLLDVLPMAALAMLVGLELAVALIQAYVFSLIACNSVVKHVWPYVPAVGGSSPPVPVNP